jgi:hypothetical protein
VFFDSFGELIRENKTLTHLRFFLGRKNELLQYKVHKTSESSPQNRLHQAAWSRLRKRNDFRRFLFPFLFCLGPI